MRVSSEEIVAAYRETGSVWKAGKRVGLAGQSVWERLRGLGYKPRTSVWTDEELDELRALAGNVTIGEIAHRLGRPYAGVAIKISRLGLGTRYGNRGVERKRVVGWDKQSTKHLVDQLERFDGPLRRFCRMRGLDIEAFVQAAQRHFPERWDAYTRGRSDIGEKQCPYCARVFYPLSGKQRNCSRKCASTERQDRAYFGGKRRETVGLAEGICQLCRRHVKRGLSSHHVLGKENDPENDVLVALCSGCHKIVTLLASRSFVKSTEAWQDLIHLCIARADGKGLADGTVPGEAFVCVEIEQYEPEEN